MTKAGQRLIEAAREMRDMVSEKPTPQDADRALIREVAMDIGKQAVSHLRTIYPAAFAALGPSGQLSLRNTVHNEIMAALDTTDADEIARRLDERRAHRRKMHVAYDKMRETT